MYKYTPSANTETITYLLVVILAIAVLIPSQLRLLVTLRCVSCPVATLEGMLLTIVSVYSGYCLLSGLGVVWRYAVDEGLSICSDNKVYHDFEMTEFGR